VTAAGEILYAFLSASHVDPARARSCRG